MYSNLSAWFLSALTGVTLVKPLWERPRGHILDALEANHFDMIITCCNLSKTGKELAEDLMTKRGADLMQALRKLSGK